MSSRNSKSQKVWARVPLALFDGVSATKGREETASAFIVEAIRREVQRRNQMPKSGDGSGWY